MNKGNGRIYYIDYIRAFSVIWIVSFWHIQEYSNLSVRTSFYLDVTNAILAVFMFISGVFCGNKSVSSLKDVFRYWVERFGKIYPLFVVACVSFYLLNKFVSPEIFGQIAGARQLLATISGFGFLVLPMAGTVWFMSIMCFFYLITPLFLLIHRWYRWICVAILYLLLYFLYLSKCIEIDARILYLFPAFWLGGVLGKKCIALEHYITDKASKKTVYIIAAVSVICAGLCFGVNHAKKQYEIDSESTVYILVFNIFFAIFLFAFALLVRFIVSAWHHIFFKSIHNILLYISMGSMCAYLFHRIFCGFIYLFFGVLNIFVWHLFLLPVFYFCMYRMQQKYEKSKFVTRNRKMQEETFSLAIDNMR